MLHSAAGGEPTGPLKLDVAAVLSKRELLEATVLASAVTRRSASLAEKPVRDVGQQLFEALFTGPVYGTYRASLGARQLADTYTLAVTAQDADDWVAAAVGYDQILQTDPAYRDVAARKEACQRQQQVADLTAELRQHAAVGEWQAVLDVNTELARLDPSSSDPDGLASRARATLIVGHPAAGHPAAGQAATAPPTADRIRGDTQVRAADGTLRPRLVQRISGGFWMVNALSWHPDGRRIAVVSISALARVYDVSGQKPKEELTVKAGDLAHKGFDVAFSPDGTRLATASLKTRIWDVANRPPGARTPRQLGYQGGVQPG